MSDSVNIEDLDKNGIIRLINQGHQFDLTDNPFLLYSSIDDNNIDEVRTLSKCYLDHMINIDPIEVDYRIVEILRPTMRVVISDPIVSGILSVDEIMNLIANTDPSQPIKFDVSHRYELLHLYLTLLNRPMNLSINNIDKTVALYNPLDHINISSIDIDGRRLLLSNAIDIGDLNTARLILNSYSEEERVDIVAIIRVITPYTLMGMKCMIDILDEYEWISISKNSIIVDLINMDINLKYCTSDEFSNHIAELDEGDYLQITNRGLMRTLKGIVRDTNYWINDEFEGYSNTDSDSEYDYNCYGGMSLAYAVTAIAVTDSISDDNIDKLLTMLTCDDYVSSVMTLLINLHIEKLIDLRSYRTSSRYIEFIADRLPVSKLLRMKNARSSEREPL